MWRFNICETYFIIGGMHLAPLARFPQIDLLNIIPGIMGILLRPYASSMDVIMMELHIAITSPSLLQILSDVSLWTRFFLTPKVAGNPSDAGTCILHGLEGCC